MADQELKSTYTLFWIDFHKVKVAEARRAIKKRISECAKFGISRLKVVYGTPDRFQGSIAEALHQVLESGSPVDPSSVPFSFWRNPAEFTRNVPFIEVSISQHLGPSNPTLEWAFSPFNADFEDDPWKRNKCQNWFYPRREWHTATEVAARLGQHCSLGELAEVLGAFDGNLVRRTSTGAVHSVSASLLPDLVAAWARFRLEHPHTPHHSPAKLTRKRRRKATEDLPSESSTLSDGNTTGMIEPDQPSDPAPVRRAFTSDDWCLQVKEGRRLFDAGEFCRAREAFDAARIEGRHLGWKYEYVCLSNLGFACETEHRLDEAGEFYLGALALAEKHGPKDGELANSARWNLQTVLGEAPQFPSPEASTVLSSEMLIENFRHRALELERKGHRREAMDLIQSASSLAFQTDAPAIVQGLLLQQLSGIKYSLGDYQEALSVAQRGFSLTKAKLAGHHPVNVALRMTMALAARYLGDVRLALEHLANIANEPGDGVYPGFRALASTHLGTCYRMLGRLSEAERFHNLAIRIESERGEGASWICGLGQSNLGVVYREMNQLDRAEKAYKTALKTTIAATGGASSQTAEIQANLGMLFLAQNRPDAADRHLQASLDIRRTLLGENSPQTAHSLYGLSQLRLSQGRLDDAVSLATEAVRIRSQSLGENHPSTLRAKAVLEQIRIIGTR